MAARPFVRYADDAGDERRDLRRHRPSAAAEIGDDHAAGQQRHHRGIRKSATIQFIPQPIPLPRRPGEKRLALAGFSGEEAIKPQAVLLHGRPGVGLFARDEPEFSGGGIEFVED